MNQIHTHTRYLLSVCVWESVIQYYTHRRQNGRKASKYKIVLLSGPRLAQEDLVSVFSLWADMPGICSPGERMKWGGGGGEEKKKLISSTNHSSSESLRKVLIERLSWLNIVLMLPDVNISYAGVQSAPCFFLHAGERTRWCSTGDRKLSSLWSESHSENTAEVTWRLRLLTVIV